MLINSSPPIGRKAQGFALRIESFQATFLTHTSYVDTTRIEVLSEDDRVDKALADPDGHCGPLTPSLRQTMKNLVEEHGSLNPEQQTAVLDE